MGGHLDALKYLRTELRCEWTPNAVLVWAAWNGHVHVLQWAIKNGASLVSTLSLMHSRLLRDVCMHGHVATLEWLVAAQPPILEHVFDVLSVRAPASARILEILSSHVGITTVVEALQSLLDHGDALFAPSVVEWCMQQGMRFDEDFFYRMMEVAARAGDVRDAEHFMRLGATWHAEHIITALECTRISFCQWVHKRGDLKFDFSGAFIFIDRLELPALVWLASIGVFLPVDSGIESLLFVLEHYPRYELQH